MKKIVLFILLFQLQSAYGQVLRMGPKAGVQTSRAVYDDKDFYELMQSKYGLGYHTGLVMNVKVSELISLQSELLYNQVIKRLKGNGTSQFNQEKYKFVTLPILLRVSHTLGLNQVYFNAGPNISYWLGGTGRLRTGELAEYNLDELAYTISFDETKDDMDVMVVSHPNRILLGLDLGLGCMLPMGKNHLMLDLRYTLGHTNMAKPETSYINIPGFVDNLNYSNDVLSFSCAYLIDFDFFTLSTKGKTISNKKK
ncbi:outer membrane beta-barrel protein [Catalinimonas niigatensis]|uniref:outer membrane beta-barrel protein n=1 Tax=Catalinimonas niigatensis TaxID=1397264 RepID=UPI0026669FB6|nr:outer membrane beta-barrel protein [Catalinimonas niigatensis]WPP49905.1 outer membrane beta-barrel protein [Catalinimonas niigatensis]